MCQSMDLECEVRGIFQLKTNSKKNPKNKSLVLVVIIDCKYIILTSKREDELNTKCSFVCCRKEYKKCAVVLFGIRIQILTSSLTCLFIGMNCGIIPDISLEQN